MKFFPLSFCVMCLCAAGLRAADPALTERDITVSLQAPDTSWSLEIRSIVQVEDELRVVAELSQQRGRMAAMMITTVSDTVSLPLPEFPVSVYVIGKTWNWENEEDVTFVEGWTELDPLLKGGQRLYPQPTDGKK
jgi:hypothetical protein